MQESLVRENYLLTVLKSSQVDPDQIKRFNERSYRKTIKNEDEELLGDVLWVRGREGRPVQ